MRTNTASHPRTIDQLRNSEEMLDEIKQAPKRYFGAKEQVSR
jgi:hypothetical protein